MTMTEDELLHCNEQEMLLKDIESRIKIVEHEYADLRDRLNAMKSDLYDIFRRIITDLKGYY